MAIICDWHAIGRSNGMIDVRLDAETGEGLRYRAVTSFDDPTAAFIEGAAALDAILKFDRQTARDLCVLFAKACRTKDKMIGDFLQDAGAVREFEIPSAELTKYIQGRMS